MSHRITESQNHRITESQNHRMVGVGRDLCGSSSPTTLLKSPCSQGALDTGGHNSLDLESLWLHLSLHSLFLPFFPLISAPSTEATESI